MSTWFLIRTIGPELTLKLQREFAGKKIYIPRNMHPEHKIAKAIGLAAAEALSREAAQNMLRINSDQVIKQRNRRILELYDGGLDYHALAAMFALHERWIRAIIVAQKAGEPPPFIEEPPVDVEPDL